LPLGDGKKIATDSVAPDVDRPRHVERIRPREPRISCRTKAKETVDGGRASGPVGGIRQEGPLDAIGSNPAVPQEKGPVGSGKRRADLVLDCHKVGFFRPTIEDKVGEVSFENRNTRVDVDPGAGRLARVGIGHARSSYTALETLPERH